MTATDEVVAVAEALNHLELRKAELDLEVAALKGRLARLLDVGESAADRDGRPLYRLAPGRRTFNQRLAAEALPPPLYDKYLVAAIDGAALKRDSTALWEACCKVGEPYLVVVR